MRNLFDSVAAFFKKKPTTNTVGVVVGYPGEWDLSKIVLIEGVLSSTGEKVMVPRDFNWARVTHCSVTSSRKTNTLENLDLQLATGERITIYLRKIGKNEISTLSNEIYFLASTENSAANNENENENENENKFQTLSDTARVAVRCQLDPAFQGVSLKKEVEKEKNRYKGQIRSLLPSYHFDVSKADTDVAEDIKKQLGNNPNFRVNYNFHNHNEIFGRALTEVIQEEKEKVKERPSSPKP